MRKMENFNHQPGFNFNAPVASPSTSTFQNLDISLSTLLLKSQSPRPCKDVLRQAIRVKTIKRGQVMPEIDKSSTVPKKRRKPLQGEIPEEMQLRRKKNREAARKCRLKKKEIKEILNEKINKYEDRNRTLEDDIKNYREEVSRLQSLLRQHKCTKSATDSGQHCLDVEKEIPSRHVAEHEVPQSTTAEDIVHSLDDLLSGLDDNDCWGEELQHMI